MNFARLGVNLRQKNELKITTWNGLTTHRFEMEEKKKHVKRKKSFKFLLAQSKSS